MAMLHIKKGDTVFVLAGDDKGKTGRVLSIDAKKNRAIVEGINMVSTDVAPSATYNLAGQRVTNAKGILVKDGKKLIVQ